MSRTVVSTELVKCTVQACFLQQMAMTFSWCRRIGAATCSVLWAIEMMWILGISTGPRPAHSQGSLLYGFSPGQQSTRSVHIFSQPVMWLLNQTTWTYTICWWLLGSSDVHIPMLTLVSWLSCSLLVAGYMSYSLVNWRLQLARRLCLNGCLCLPYLGRTWL